MDRPVDFEPESGYKAMHQILSQKQRPTAVFCGGDIMAMGAICAADELGLRVPQDISVIGYDNVRNARYFTPALTTIHQPKERTGEMAFTMLLDRIISKREESQVIEVHPKLIERRSVADGRSSTTAANPRAGSLRGFRFRLAQPLLIQRLTIAQYASSQLIAGEGLSCCQVRQQGLAGNGCCSCNAFNSPRCTRGSADAPASCRRTARRTNSRAPKSSPAPPAAAGYPASR